MVFRIALLQIMDMHVCKKTLSILLFVLLVACSKSRLVYYTPSLVKPPTLVGCVNAEPIKQVQKRKLDVLQPLLITQAKPLKSLIKVKLAGSKPLVNFKKQSNLIVNTSINQTKPFAFDVSFKNVLLLILLLDFIGFVLSTTVFINSKITGIFVGVFILIAIIYLLYSVVSSITSLLTNF